MESTERDGERQGERAQGSWRTESCPPLQPLRQPGIPLEAEREVQDRAWKMIRDEEARLEKRDTDVAEQESRLREEEAAAPCGGGRVIPDPEGDTPPNGLERRSPFEQRARGEGDDAGHALEKRRPVQGAKRGARARKPQP